MHLSIYNRITNWKDKNHHCRLIILKNLKSLVIFNKIKVINCNNISQFKIYCQNNQILWRNQINKFNKIE